MVSVTQKRDNVSLSQGSSSKNLFKTDLFKKLETLLGEPGSLQDVRTIGEDYHIGGVGAEGAFIEKRT